jgi:3,4-dihydroxy 2-butanone 4-phosphate synthase/GTP cyclohydrolase II
MNEDGSMARLPQLAEVAKKFDLKLVSIEDLVAYRMQHDIIKKKKITTLKHATVLSGLEHTKTTNKQIHIALTKGTWNIGEPVMTRINSTLVNNDILGTLTNDADKKLDNMFHLINKENRGAILFINQEVQSIDLLNRIVELKDLQTQGIYKAPQVKMDNKDFGIGAQILHDIDISKN